MKKVYIILLLLVMMISAGCGTETTSSHNTESDIELDKPSVTITENNTLGKDVSDIESEKNSSGNSDDRIIDSGFWVNELKTDNGMVWKYTPLINPKVAGVFDCEDDAKFVFSYEYSGYNRPDGTKTATLKSYGCQFIYVSNPMLGYNADEEVYPTQEKQIKETFSLTTNNGINKLGIYDVGCITFALYKDLYPEYPEMKLQVYGIPNNLIEQRFDDITKCDGRAYKDFLVKDCPNEDFVSCVYLGEKDITDTSIFYIDYKKMAEENDCGQFLLVLKVSKTTGFAYLMNGDNCYNISDNEKYQVWKQEHIGQFIGE